MAVKNTWTIRLATEDDQRIQRSSRTGGCQCWRHNVLKACQRLSSIARRGGAASSRPISVATMDSAGAPVTAPARSCSDASHAAQLGGKPVSASGRIERSLRRFNSACRSSAAENTRRVSRYPAAPRAM